MIFKNFKEHLEHHASKRFFECIKNVYQKLIHGKIVKSTLDHGGEGR